MTLPTLIRRLTLAAVGTAAACAGALSPAAASAAPATDGPFSTTACGIDVVETTTYSTPFHESNGSVTGFQTTTYSTGSGTVTVTTAGRSQLLSESESGATIQLSGLLAKDASGATAPIVVAGRAIETIDFDASSGAVSDTLTITQGQTTTTLEKNAQFCSFAVPILG